MGMCVIFLRYSDEHHPLLFSRDGIPPYSELVIDSLSASQPYDISLHITVPATEANYALGNFMTSLIISTPKNATLIEVRKPVILSAI